MREAAPSPLDRMSVAVTGASRGIGAATAVACADAGAESVALLGRTWDDLSRVADEVQVRGAEAAIIPCDVTSKNSIDQAFESIDQVDAVVNSAGGNQPEPFVEVSEETLDRLVALNLRGAFFVMQAAVKKMRSGDAGGAIITMSSQMGHVGAANRSVYCATKHAVEGLTKAVAVELAPLGVRVLSIAPTFVRTDMTATQLDDPVIGPELLGEIPVGRFGTVEDVASAVVYAASPAAGLMTGCSLLLDGGWTAK